ncbi:RagB/SusD family nutrient uptake outer membrane protein [Segatella paludivivens]|uniref:RagB/SusD family nutrient uptake outer membrane protein n=1 Tax=Segatella paludivivens TaxID=185294 RepID=UPI000375F67E|nr:RagB/SusD family nutrient uptake outer membrane protein [Segatella paludivivens]
MKSIYKSIIIGVSALSLTACSLDYDPISTPTELTQGTSSDTATAVLKDRQAAIDQRTNLYELLKNRQEHWHLDYLLVGDSHTDNAYAGTTGAEVEPYETNSIDASNSVLGRDWSRYLEDVAKANVLINGLEELKTKGLVSDNEYHQWKAEGELFRALVMFNMARLWGSFPIITKVAKTITAENVGEVYPTYFPPRSTDKECYQQIISDLSDAEQYAPDFNSADRTVLSKVVAQAMFAKVYAEKPVQDYSKVIEYADKVRGVAGMALEPDFSTLWGYDADKKDCVKRNTSEGILEVHWTTGNANWESWMYGRSLENYDYYFSWAKWITPSRDLIKDFESENDTTRMNQTIVYYACKWSNYYPASRYPFMYKYRSGYNNQYKLRLADIILLEAEAYAYKGDNTKSADLVNLIRNRAKLPNLTADKTATKEAMIEAVLHERRLELALEGERWYDLCRNNKVEEYLNGLNNRDSGRLLQRKQYDANSYLLPIPQSALDENTNLQQNPGY